MHCKYALYLNLIANKYNKHRPTQHIQIIIHLPMNCIKHTKKKSKQIHIVYAYLFKQKTKTNKQNEYQININTKKKIMKNIVINITKIHVIITKHNKIQIIHSFIHSNTQNPNNPYHPNDPNISNSLNKSNLF